MHNLKKAFLAIADKMNDMFRPNKTTYSVYQIVLSTRVTTSANSILIFKRFSSEMFTSFLKNYLFLFICKKIKIPHGINWNQETAIKRKQFKDCSQTNAHKIKNT